MNPMKVEEVKDWLIPKSMIDVRSFLRLEGYYQRFVHNFSKIAGSLTKLMHKGEMYIWTDKCNNAFEELKIEINFCTNVDDIR